MDRIALHWINGIKYAVGRMGRTWVAAYDCDCILGPHWHEFATAPTKSELLTAVRAWRPDCDDLAPIAPSEQADG